ncbi:MAG TPA: hypothetical protein VI039_12960 [Solirubrobacterales bacterium]
MAHAKAVHRPLTLHTPILSGADVKALQGQINEQFDHLKIDRTIAVDGDLGRETFAAAKQVAIGLGAQGSGLRKLKRETISEGVQKLIRGRKRTVLEQAAAARRTGYRRKLRKRHATDAGERAVALGRQLLGTKEVPEGSNWGGKVEDFIRFTGYTGPVFWCGCFACWVVVKLGGARIPTRIRLGYAPYITADALAGVNGLKAVRAEDARPGDIVCLWGGQHIEVVAGVPRSGSVLCLGGNTTAGGQESNGGEVAENFRSISDFDRGIVARPDWN